MTEIAWYIRNMICFICFFQVFLHLVPREQYRKYLKFFGNLLLVFLLIRPVAAFVGKGEELENILRLETLKGAYSEMEMHMEGVEELKTEVINRTFQEEIKRQIREIPEAYGLSVLTMEMDFQEETTPKNLTMKLLNDGAGDSMERIEKIKGEIQEIYGISTDQMRIYVQG